MKKIVLLFSAILCLTLTANAQEISKNAIGLRLGDSNGFGAEISYQRAFKDHNRFEVGFGWRNGNDYDGIKLIGLYQWIWVLHGDFNWYVGAGGGLGTYNFDNKALDNSAFGLVAGNIGIEYNFDIPLLISLDFRPEFVFGNYTDDIVFDIGLGIRYLF